MSADISKHKSAHRSNKFGTPFDPSILDHLVKDAKDTEVVKVPCVVQVRDKVKPEVTIRSIWVGSYPSHRTPYSVLVTDDLGNPKKSGSIINKGRSTRNRPSNGYAQVSLDIGDIIVVSVRTITDTRTILLRVDLFTAVEDNKCDAICTTLEVNVYNFNNEHIVYTHDTDREYLDDINEHVRDRFVDLSRENTSKKADWNQFHLYHISSVPRKFKRITDYSTVTNVEIHATDRTFFDELKEAAIHFHKELRNVTPEGERTPSVYNYRTPLLITYIVVDDKTVDLVVDIPYCDRLIYTINENSFYGLIDEPILLLYDISVDELVEDINKKSKDKGQFTVERTFRM